MVNDIAWHNILNEEISVGHLFIQIMTQVSFFRRRICELGFSELGTLVDKRTVDIVFVMISHIWNLHIRTHAEHYVNRPLVDI